MNVWSSVLSDIEGLCPFLVSTGLQSFVCTLNKLESCTIIAWMDVMLFSVTMYEED